MEYIVYMVPLLMLIFIGSLVMMLVCVRVRGCAALTASLGWPITASTSAGSVPQQRNQIHMQTGEIVLIANTHQTDIAALENHHMRQQRNNL